MAITALTAALLLASPLASHEDVAPQIPVTVPISASVVSTSPVAATALADTNPAPPDPINDIVVTGRAGPPPGDPLERVNEVTFSAVQAVDSAIIEPVAQAYEAAVPSPVRSGIRNFLGNLHEPETCLNFLLQHRIGKAFETFARFAINSTIGLAGLIDVAKRKPFNLKRRYNGFANTLGFYGVKTGAYFYLPLIGATTVRDFIGYSIDKLLLPTSVGKPFNQASYNLPTGALAALDHRNVTAADIESMRDGNRNGYAKLREGYLARRQAEIDALHSKDAGLPLR